MNAKMLTRLSVAVLLGVSFDLWVSHSYEQWRHLGREAYLASQAQRFDWYMATPNHGTELIFYPALAITACCVYE